MPASALTVSDLNEYVRRSLAGDPMLRNISVRGEISNFKPYASGHWYFSLKDDNSRLSCVMFRQHNMSLRFMPKEGDKVVLTGSAGLYVASGSYQFYVEGMAEDGVGELYRQFLMLKEQLLKEGLFDPARKRPLPLLPQAVGIVTSQSGAVLHDIKTVARRRFPGMPLILRPSLVQGEGAKEDLVRALNEIAALDAVDVVIIGRGGGSMEDLWAFNEESVVRAIAACPKPVISAVGHETDTTLADYAADMRAPTPSAAAELAVPLKADLEQRIAGYIQSLHGMVLQQLNDRLQQVRLLEARLMLRSPDAMLNEAAHRLAAARTSILAAVEGTLQRLSQHVSLLSGTLRALGPEETLRRGYAVAMHGSNVLTSVHDLPEVFDLLMQDGRASLRRLTIKEGDHDGEQE